MIRKILRECPELSALLIVGGLALGSIHNYHTGRQAYRKKVLDTEEDCGYGRNFIERFTEGDRWYVAGIPTPFTERELKISEIEIQCGYARVHGLAFEDAQFIVARKELFPDGSVKVLWDPGNKYQSANTQAR